MSKDPIGFAGGAANLFTYVESGPVSVIDPSGLQVSGTFNLGSGVIKLSNGKGQSVSAFAFSGTPGYTDRSGPNAALPAGEYRIGYDSKDGYFTLDPIDDIPNNDKHDATGRGRFRLHIPGGSTGCIAIGRGVKDRNDPSAVSAWLALKQFVENNWEPFSMAGWEKVGGGIRRPSYGTLTVK
jgi:hypothetical protein